MTTQQLEIWRKLTAESETNLEARIKYDKLMEEKVGIIKETKIPSFGEQLIGVEFNPSQQEDVAKVKQMFAEIAEILKKNYQGESRHPLKSLIFDHAVGEILNAQMSVVKVLTLKHYTENETDGTQGTN